MRKKIIGLVLLICVMADVGGIYLLTGGSGDGEKKETGTTQPRTAVSGYVGGEKIGFLADEEVLSILGEKYGRGVDYSKAGSLDMMTADLEGRNYLFPSSSIALEYYEELHGSPAQSEILLNTTIVLYTHKVVLEAFDRPGLIAKDGDVKGKDGPRGGCRRPLRDRRRPQCLRLRRSGDRRHRKQDGESPAEYPSHG